MIQSLAPFKQRPMPHNHSQEEDSEGIPLNIHSLPIHRRPFRKSIHPVVR